jgi:potassium-transporting ATPase KdpC subunit
MDILRQLRIALLSTIVLTILLGILYPVAIWAVAQLAFPAQANGSLLRSSDGTVVGSRLLAQGFTDAKYFHARPSAAGADGYDAGASSGSNLAPGNQKLIDAVTERVKAYREENGLSQNTLVPVDAVTTSASGLDPDITVANAYLQARRVAKARGMSEGDVKAVIDRIAVRPLLGFWGTPSVNVLRLNLTLDGWTGL